jgi:endonuclease/exonuclease/phosphatase family metal-dependent hydrolase
VAVAAAGVLVLLVGFVMVLGGQRRQDCDPGGSPVQPGTVPVAAVSVAGLDAGQLANARLVVGEGRRSGMSDRGIVVALATALQESRLRNYANDGRGGDLGPDQRGIAASLRLRHDAVGSDHGSLGIMQQQWAWWGSMRELMDPATAARKFYASLTRVPGWETMPVTVAAQTVQRSAHPSAYADDEATAKELLAELDSAEVAAVGSAGAGSTSQLGGATRTGGAAGAVTAGYSLGAVQPQLTALVNALGPRFQIRTVGGYRASARDPGGHPSGRAADFMTSSREQGDRLAGYARRHAGELGVDYILWRQRIWSAARATEGWRPMADRGSVTENHLDHVHINQLPNASLASIDATAPSAGEPEVDLERGDCAGVAPGAAGGPVVVPLPAGTGYTDARNWGRSGSRWARRHTGTDLAVGCGTPVLAAHAGTVVVDASQSWAGRWLVQVSTRPGGLATWYAHMRAVTVAAGQRVRPGQQLGQVGAEGNATGCHLHFEVHPDGGSIYADGVDPTMWLARNVGRPADGGPGARPVGTSGGPVDAAPPPGRVVTVMTYNIRFGQYGVANLARDIARANPDLVGLNEIDVFPARGYSQARDLARRLGMYLVYGGNKSWGRAKTRGNAILSRWPLTAASNTRLPGAAGTEPRGLLAATVHFGDGRSARIFVTHLHFAGAVRHRQARAVAARIGQPACPTWLTGDLNFAPRGNPGMYAALTRDLGDAFASGRYGRGATAPARSPTGRIDYVLHGGGVVPVAARVLPAGASDHRAVRTNYLIPRGASC